MPEIKTIGFIGLGIMGKPMAQNLLKADFQLTAYDLLPSKVDEVVAAGATAAGSASECSRNMDVVVTMLPDSPDSELAILGPNGVLDGASKGCTIIDMSSIAPTVSQKIAVACEAKGVLKRFAQLDGSRPATGGSKGKDGKKPERADDRGKAGKH